MRKDERHARAVGRDVRRVRGGEEKQEEPRRCSEQSEQRKEGGEGRGAQRS